MLADTDGDGELEAVTWRKVGSDAKGDKRYVISIMELVQSLWIQEVPGK